MPLLDLDTTFLSPGNSKTGDTASFDLPARVTCPGMTTSEDGCSQRCYAARLSAIRPVIASKYDRNLVFSQGSSFVAYMIAMLPENGIIRIHVSGDFYSAPYIRKWIRIIENRPDCHFYAYTRSWRLPRMEAALTDLSSLDNFTLNVSVDAETGKPPRIWRKFKWCYLAHKDNAPNWLRKTDLVFRSKHWGHKVRRKNAIAKGVEPPALVHNLGKNSTPVCPVERGTDLTLTCSSCRICL